MSEKTKTTSFEQALKELESIADLLEKGQMTLEESIKSYERGMELKKICAQKLEEAEGKIEILSQNNEKKASGKKETKENKIEKDNNLF